MEKFPVRIHCKFTVEKNIFTVEQKKEKMKWLYLLNRWNQRVASWTKDDLVVPYTHESGEKNSEKKQKWKKRPSPNSRLDYYLTSSLTVWPI